MISESLSIFDVMSTNRAMRKLRTDPIPDDVIWRIVEAGTWAPNGANRQTWRFIIVKDPTIKRAVQRIYKRAYDEVMSTHYAEAATPPGMSAEKFAAQHGAVEYLTDHFHEAPVWIVACLEEPDGPAPWSGASIYPAVQNMLLAARALGIGSTLTCRHLLYGAEADTEFGLPPEVRSYAILPLGYPLGRFGPVRRGELEEFVHADRWGTPFLRAPSGDSAAAGPRT